MEWLKFHDTNTKINLIDLINLGIINMLFEITKGISTLTLFL